MFFLKVKEIVCIVRLHLHSSSAKQTQYTYLYRSAKQHETEQLFKKWKYFPEKVCLVEKTRLKCKRRCNPKRCKRLHPWMRLSVMRKELRLVLLDDVFPNARIVRHERIKRMLLEGRSHFTHCFLSVLLDSKLWNNFGTHTPKCGEILWCEM